MLSAVVLAGCASDDDPSGDDVGVEPVDGDDGDNGSSNGSDGTDGLDGVDGDDGDGDGNTTTPDAPELEPLELNLSADVTEGSVPFDVTFNFTVDDPDREGLSWTLDADGDGEVDTEGTSLPFNYTATFDVEGNYTAVFTVSDGEDEYVSEVVVIALPPPQPQLQEMSCYVDTGLGNPVLSVSGPEGMGGCNFGTIDQPMIFFEQEIASGCEVHYDTTPGDTQTEGAAELGREYPSGTSFNAYCDIGVAAEELTIWMADPDDPAFQ